MVLGVLDIKPENVNGEILFVEALLHAPNVVGTDVVPSALVITQRPMRRKLNRSGQFRVLAEDLVRRGPGEEEDVKNAGLGDPVCLSRFLSGVSDVYPGFGGGGDEDGDSGICGVRVDQGNRPIQRHGGRSEVFEDVGIIEPVWITEE